MNGGQRRQQALTLCSRPRGFRILCTLKILSKPQEAKRGFEGWHCNPRTLPASPFRQPSRRPGEGGRHQRQLGGQQPFIVYCLNHFIVQYLILKAEIGVTINISILQVKELRHRELKEFVCHTAFETRI